VIASTRRNFLHSLAGLPQIAFGLGALALALSVQAETTYNDEVQRQPLGIAIHQPIETPGGAIGTAAGEAFALIDGTSRVVGVIRLEIDITPEGPVLLGDK